MTSTPDPDAIKGPGGLSIRQVHEQVKKSVERDCEAALKTRTALARRESQWQRFIRYVCDRSGQGKSIQLFSHGEQQRLAVARA